MSVACLTCKKPIRQPKTGRKRKYCSDRCKEEARPRRAERSSPHKAPPRKPATQPPRKPAPAVPLMDPGPGTPNPSPENVISLDFGGSGEVCHVCHGPGGKGALPVCDDCHGTLNA